MNLWLLVWFFITTALLYFFVWTIFILLRQKKNWDEFSRKNQLRYTPGRLQDPPEVNGNYKGYTISLFTGEHMTPDLRGTRKLSAIEVQLTSKVPFEGGVASRGMVDFLREVGFKNEIIPKHAMWKSEYIAASNTPYALQSYLTNARLEALSSIMRVKNAWVILIFRGDMALLRFDTPDPLETQKKIESIMDRMIDVAKKLELEAGEAARLKEDSLRTSPREASIHIQDDNISLEGIQLEDSEETKPSLQSQNDKAQKDENGN